MLEIIPGSHLTVTPYGAWQAVTRADQTPQRQVLLGVLREAISPLLSLESIRTWTGESDPEAALEHLLRLQEEIGRAHV